LGLIKPAGVNIQYDLEITFETAQNVSSVQTPIISKPNQFTFSGDLTSDLTFNFNFDG
jgi:hypothetical protein